MKLTTSIDPDVSPDKLFWELHTHDELFWEMQKEASSLAVLFSVCVDVHSGLQTRQIATFNSFFASKPTWRRFHPFNIRDFTLTIAAPPPKMRLKIVRKRLKTVSGQVSVSQNKNISNQTHLNSHSENVWLNTDKLDESFSQSESVSDNVLVLSPSTEFTRPGRGKSVMAANTTNKQVQTTNFSFSRCRIDMIHVETIVGVDTQRSESIQASASRNGSVHRDVV